MRIRTGRFPKMFKGSFGHTRDLRDRFLNGWFRWFFEINTQFEIFAQPTLVTPRKQPLEFWYQRSLIGTLQTFTLIPDYRLIVVSISIETDLTPYQF
jgi:hypothetical protein